MNGTPVIVYACDGTQRLRSSCPGLGKCSRPVLACVRPNDDVLVEVSSVRTIKRYYPGVIR